MKTCTRLAMFIVAGSIAALAAQANGQVVISQVYGGGGNAGSTYKNDFIELYNRGTSSVNITGWSVQYASAAGTTWQVTNLTNPVGDLAPGQYYLVQEALGAGGTTNLPTPDATGTIAMSATAGKVALVNVTTAQTGSCPTGAQIVDFVGYGTTASCFEGAGPTPAPSNTNAVLRNAGGCIDANNNSADFTAALPTPRNTSTIAPCGGACCVNNNCSVTTQNDCVNNLGGTYLGDNTNCNNNPCAPTGACCISDSNCSITSQANCTGTYEGDGSVCAPNGCCWNVFDARFAAANTVVRTCEVVVASLDNSVSGTNTAFTVQDLSNGGGPYGITIFGPNSTGIDELVATLTIGDRIRLSNVTRTTFQALAELTYGATTTASAPTPGTPVAYAPVTSGDFINGALNGETLESTLVELPCVAFVASGNFTGGTNYTVTDGTNSVTVRVPGAATLPQIVGTAIPQGMVTLRGVFTQSSTGSATAGYQLLIFDRNRDVTELAVNDPNCASGPCCKPDASCRQLSQAACESAAIGGVFHNEAADCASLTCPNLLGSCCINGACLTLAEADCTAQAGTFGGVGTTCSPYPCPESCAQLSVAHARSLVPTTAGQGVQTRICQALVTSTTDLINSTNNWSIYAQDNSGAGGTPIGITIFGQTAQIQGLIDAGVAPGKTITLQSKTNVFSALAEMDLTVGPFQLVSIDGNPGLPTPTTVDPGMFDDNSPEGEALESTLVRTTCVTFVETGTFAALTNYHVTDGANTAIVRVSTTAQTDIIGQPIPSGQVKVTGVITQFDSAAGDGLDDGYQLLIRTIGDIGPCVVGPQCCPGGDMNTSGVIDSNDLNLFVDAVLGITPNACANTNGDADVNALDIQEFTNRVLANGGNGTTCTP